MTFTHFYRRLLPFIGVISLGLAHSVRAQDGLTLDAYFDAALQRSETTAIQLQQIQQAEEVYRQANAALLPTINGVVSYTWLDPLPAGTQSTPSNLSQQHVSRFTATQPLFRGMREYAALRQTRDLLSAQRQDYRQARVSLYQDVLQNFFSILALESDIRNYQEEIRLNREREQDIRARVRIGRSRDSELLNEQSSISTLNATVEQLRGQLQVARQGFAFLSGLNADTALQDNLNLPAQLEPLPAYLAGIQDRPDVHAAQQRLVAASEGIAIARGEHYPSLDLNANYYLERPGYLDDSKWDVQLLLTIPLYAGGSVQSKVRQATAERNQVELTQTQIKRQADQEIRSLYQSIVSNLSQLEALIRATAAAKKSYAAQVRDYKLGLVTNLDVLQALTAFQQNQRTLDHTVFTAKSNYLQLLTAAARMPTQGVKP
ncbi:MAG: TolC family protein [Gammaproteobacteria bacterium]|nr:TolC family protein [Gammaproteobacteria bacterium]